MTPDPDWLTTRKAAGYLSISVHTLRGSKILKDAVQRKFVGDDCRCGVLWFRPDLEAIIAVRRRYKLRTVPSARLVQNGVRA